VRFKGIIAAAASVALIATPTMVAAQTASAAAAEVAPAAETVDGANQLKGNRGGAFVILFSLAAVIAALLILLRDKEELPTSP
jgi:hypothetical protein